jgi:exo-beta-1,3-glucanase (GH17 family)
MCILADQVKADMRQIATMSSRVKTYSLNCLPQTKTIITFAKENGMTIMLGVWVDKDAKRNDVEIKRLVELLGEMGDSGGVITDILVGNEAVFSQKASPAELLRMIKKAKDAVAGAGLSTPVGTAEIYQTWTGKANEDSAAAAPLTDVATEVDFIGLNVHPYYGGIDPLDGDKAGKFVRDEQLALEKFYITETGFPTKGTPNKTGAGTSTPGVKALSAFAQQVEDVSRKYKLPVFFFEPYDGDWKRRWLPYTETDYSFGLHTCKRELKDGIKLPGPGAV